jgi:carbon starvation protein CstA
MNDKMKECFTPHALMHSLAGLGVGLVVAHFWSDLSANVWVGVGVIVVAVVLDMMRK